MTVHPTLADLQNEATWLERRSLIPEPLVPERMVTTEQSRREFLEGARLLRLDQIRNFQGEMIGPSPAQLAVADTLAAGAPLTAILEPRRTGKTSGIQAVLVGRCALREDHLVGWTLATTGAKAGERFKKDIAAPLVRLYPEKREREAFVKVELSKGSEGLVFRNGSYFNVYAPGGDGFRSNAFDDAWVDEAGEAEPALGEDLVAAIRPTLHTRHGAQFIVSGTAAKYRAGNLLWDHLIDPRAVVLRHGVPDDLDPRALEAWEADEEHPLARVRELVIAAHPGIGFTTPLSVIEEDWNTPAMRKNFPAEILGLFALEGSNTALISAPKWNEAAKPMSNAGKTAPRKFALAAFIDRDSLYASVAAAWTGADKKIHVGLLHHQTGVQGFATVLAKLAKKHKKAITHDSFSNAMAVQLRSIREARPAPLERPLGSRDVARAAVNFVNVLNDGNLRHHDQAELNAAVDIAVKRAFSSGTGWAFGRPKNRDDADITGLEAAALAVYALDQERDGSASIKDAIVFG